jgi:hypothetical protein
MFEETEATTESDFNDVILTLSSDGKIISNDSNGDSSGSSSSGSGSNNNSNAMSISGVMPGLPVTRIGDRGVGICFAHKFPVPVIITHVVGDPITMADGIPITRIDDMCICSCGHTCKNATGSILIDSASMKPIHRITDIITWSGIGISVDGSPITFSL